MKIFPEIGLEESKFSNAPSTTLFHFLLLKWHTNVIIENHWANLDNRRAFFEAFARDHGFDPHVSSNWENITTQHLRDRKV